MIESTDSIRYNRTTNAAISTAARPQSRPTVKRGRPAGAPAPPPEAGRSPEIRSGSNEAPRGAPPVMTISSSARPGLHAPDTEGTGSPALPHGVAYATGGIESTEEAAPRTAPRISDRQGPSAASSAQPRRSPTPTQRCRTHHDRLTRPSEVHITPGPGRSHGGAESCEALKG